MRGSRATMAAAIAAGLCLACVDGAWAVSPSLTGQVSSAEEGAMEGVLVSARRTGSAITVTVVTDDKGRFGFPADRLEPGPYRLTVRAAGYVLDAPRTADVAGS